ncbi:hypothetical protein scyTo_0016076 [Scyliorhinus torazame]|uniref:Uncharacterized protein n=1 Tax=Scyliorhinus torazame TaxID=75743 RepID=A0A401Q3I1_SCYTO|nr:hypothetical protein [Scyliorhinus torazame]
MHLCGYNYVRKIYEICGGWPWKAILPHRFDPFQASGDNDIPKETKKKKVQVVNANGRQQRAVAHHKQRREYDDANPYEPMPDYSSEVITNKSGVKVFTYPKLLTACEGKLSIQLVGLDVA